MIPAHCRRQLNGPGQLGWGPALCFFLFVLFCFPFCSSSPASASVAWDGVGCFTQCALIPLLFFTLLTFLSLALMSGDPALSGIGSCIINIYIYIYMKWGESGFNYQGDQGVRAIVIFVLCECIWNSPAVSLVPGFYYKYLNYKLHSRKPSETNRCL